MNYQSQHTKDSGVVVVAVVVTFNPDNSQLRQLLNVMKNHTASVVIVDNASSDLNLSTLPAGVKTIRFDTNRGIAAAHNAGINYAVTIGAHFVLLLDQDSVPEDGMVAALVEAFFKIKRDSNIAAVGSCYRQGLSPFVQLSGLSLVRAHCSPTQVVEVDQLISSGTLISVSALELVGQMKDDLFIDYVDTEWSIRAKAAGFTLWGAGNALMTHQLGERTVNILNREVPLHKPFRYYYMIRNGFSLAMSKNISSRWRLVLFIRTFKIFLLFSIFPASRVNNIKMMLKGMVHAVRGISGQLKI